MATLTYAPTLNGASGDPELEGGAVDTLKLFSNDARSGSPDVLVGPAVRVGAGLYQFTVNDILAGRFWPTVTWHESLLLTAPIVDDSLPYIDLPVRPDLLLSPEALAGRLGIPLPLTAEQRATLADAILDAQVGVESYLGRAIVPRIYTEKRVWRGWGTEQFSEQPVLAVLSEVEELDEYDQATGYWIIRYRAGLDARTDASLRPIALRVVAQAAAQPGASRLWSSLGYGATAGVGKRVKSVSAEGQSVSYEYLSASGGTASASAAGVAASAPPWPDIDEWRLAGRRAFQRSGDQGALVGVTSAVE